MSYTEIKTNNHERPFLYGYEVPEKILADDFDWLSEEEKTDHFIKYRNHYYHLSEFMALTGNSELQGWDAYSGDSYFSGVVIKLNREDCESYTIGTYYS